MWHYANAVKSDMPRGRGDPVQTSPDLQNDAKGEKTQKHGAPAFRHLFYEMLKFEFNIFPRTNLAKLINSGMKKPNCRFGKIPLVIISGASTGCREEALSDVYLNFAGWQLNFAGWH